MDIGSLFLILAIFILVGLFVARPFFENKSISVTEKEHEISSLLAERDRILGALQELDFDHQMGKIPEEDYPVERNVLLQKGANALRRLDELQQVSAGESAEERIESVVAARRADAARVRPPVPAGAAASANASAPANSSRTHLAPDDDLEALIAARRRQKEEKAAGFCTQCGSPVHQSDKFCPRCGEKL
jgi:hypothetical protein